MPVEIKLGDRKNQNSEPNWYALYTCSRQEKCVAEQIEQRRVSSFLPLYRSVRRGKDRRKELDLVLFPGYVFVQTKLEDRSRVLQLPGVARVVSFDGRPAALPVGEIERLGERLSFRSKIEPHPYLRRDRRGRVCNGPSKDYGESLCAGKNRAALFFSIDVIQRSVAVEVDEADLEMV